MNADQLTKALAPLIKRVQKEATAPLIAQNKALAEQLQSEIKARVPKVDIAPMMAENKRLKSKLRIALEQRDVWKHDALRYRETIIQFTRKQYEKSRQPVQLAEQTVPSGKQPRLQRGEPHEVTQRNEPVPPKPGVTTRWIERTPT